MRRGSPHTSASNSGLARWRSVIVVIGAIMSVHVFICALAGACLSAAALFLPLIMPAHAQTTGKLAESRAHAEAPTDTVVTEMHIWLIKAILRLRPEQEIFWAPVEAALRELARLQARPTDHSLEPGE